MLDVGGLTGEVRTESKSVDSLLETAVATGVGGRSLSLDTDSSHRGDTRWKSLHMASEVQGMESAKACSAMGLSALKAIVIVEMGF
jgi:hypothetical protein